MAADKELAEITLEQEVLREFSAKSQSSSGGGGGQQQKKSGGGGGGGGGGGKRSAAPISLNIADMISALEVCALCEVHRRMFSRHLFSH